MVLLQSPAERLTISIYGFPTDPTSFTAGPVDTEESHLISTDRLGHEDWSWLYSWAGQTPESLLDLLTPDTSTITLQNALNSLDLLLDFQGVDPPLLATLMSHPDALPFLLSLPSYPPQPILQRLYDDPEYALHENLRNYLPPGHHLRAFRMDDPPAARKVAWSKLTTGRAVLTVLALTRGDDLLDMSYGEIESNLSRLLKLVEGYALGKDEESKRCFELGLDILSRLPEDPRTVQTLARVLPRLFVISCVRGSSRALPFDLSLSPIALKFLLHSATEVIDGRSCFQHARSLALPYLDLLDQDDPIRTVFEPASDGIPPLSATLSLDDTLDGRRLARLQAAVDSKHTSSSIVHTATPTELLSILAPSLLKILQSAPLPPLGIASTLKDQLPEYQASAYAGKVYTSHEFRRDRDGTGGAGIGTLNVGAAGRGMSRPASRHVDAFA